MKYLAEAAFPLSLVILTTYALVACGDGWSDARCSDFLYQEDAQAALRSGAMQLDADKDGLACEDLPFRSTLAPAPAPAPAVEFANGLWHGITSTDRTITALVFQGGGYFVFYSAISAPNILGGLIQGTGFTSGTSSFSSSDAKDYNNEGFGVLPATVSATFETGKSLDGTFGYASGQPQTFTSAYGFQYTLRPTLESLNVIGNYRGQIGLVSGTLDATLQVNAQGQITSNFNGCSITGSALPRTDANAYNISIRFDVTPCAYSGQTMSGIAYFASAPPKLHVAVTNPDRSAAMVFVGN